MVIPDVFDSLLQGSNSSDDSLTQLHMDRLAVFPAGTLWKIAAKKDEQGRAEAALKLV